MRKFLIALCLALAGFISTPAGAQLSLGFSSGGVRLGINIPVYPRLVAVPGYPVYWAPDVNANYFFYDGAYWLFYDDNWYESEWYNGPWYMVPPDEVPLYVLRVPVRYYHARPSYFRGWALNSAPRWDQHWGRQWADNHRDWNRWDRRQAPARAPLPSYQRSYSGERYPNAERQHAEQDRNYRYQPRDQSVRRQWDQHRQGQAPQAREERRAPAPQARDQRGSAPQAREQRRESGAVPGTPGAGHSPTQKDAERWGSGG